MTNLQISVDLTKALLELYQLQPVNYLKQFVEGEVSLMFLLYQNDNKPMLPSEFSRFLNITKGRVTVILNGLSEKDFIDIAISSEDRRKFLVCLTEIGYQSIKEKVEVVNHYFEILVEKIGAEQAKQLTFIIENIANKMKDVSL